MTNPWDEQNRPQPPDQSFNPLPPKPKSAFETLVIVIVGCAFGLWGLANIIPMLAGVPSNGGANSTSQTVVSPAQTSTPDTSATAKVGFNPEQACHFMDSFDLSTSSYRPMYEGADSYLCNSPYLDLGNEDDAVNSPNNLSYYVRGSSDTAYRLRILLNVNREEEEMASRIMLAEKAVQLTRSALQIDAPPKAVAALGAGKRYKGKRKGYTIEVIRDNWKNGNGYSLEYVIRDPKFNEEI